MTALADKVSDVLKKQKRLAGMVHNQNMLAGGREPVFNESQMNVFALVDGRLQKIPIEGRKNLEASARSGLTC